MKKFMSLSRAEMKLVMGGTLPGEGTIEDDGGDSGSAGACVYCTSSAGSSCWYRKNPGTTLCIEVYPHAFITEARVAPCSAGCTMN